MLNFIFENTFNIFYPIHTNDLLRIISYFFKPVYLRLKQKLVLPKTFLQT